jgi:uncharacterized protein YodC (DUF2158 family)
MNSTRNLYAPLNVIVGQYEKDCTYIWYFVLVRILQDVPQYVYRCAWLDSNSSLHTLAVNEFDQLFRRGFLVRFAFGRLGSGGIYCSLVMKAVEVAPGLLEVSHPSLGLCNHHMAVKSPFAMCISWTIYVWPDLSDDWCAERHVWHKMAVHDVDLRASVTCHWKEGMAVHEASPHPVRWCLNTLCLALQSLPTGLTAQ